MDGPEIRIVLAGHIDHGKSTLIGRLLYETASLPDELTAALKSADLSATQGGEDRQFAYVMDHLAEERSHNITIDTAQVAVRLAGRHYVFIDAPGHRQFVRNMVTGASLAHGALLMVAANEGVREQTRRHCNLLAMLGIRQIVVVVNKMDKVLFSRRIFDHIGGELTAHLAGLGLKEPRIVPLSAQRGCNLLAPSPEMDWYSGPTLMDAIAAFVAPDARSQTPAMPVQDIYRDGAGKVLAGRVESGSFAVGDRVELCPDGPTGIIHKIETFQGPVERAAAPWCVAVTLCQLRNAECGLRIAEVSRESNPQSAFRNPQSRRGQVMMSQARRLAPSDHALGRLFWMSHATLSEGQDFKFRCSAQEARCRVNRIVSRIDSETMQPLASGSPVGFTEIAEVELSFEPPVLLTAFDQLPELGRFTLCRDVEVCAGGIFT